MALVLKMETRPWLLKTRSSNTFILTTIAMAVFTDIFLYALIIPVVPFALSERANIPQAKVSTYVSALVAAYGGSLAAFSPVFGYLADYTRTRRAPFLFGLVILAGATVMLHLGRSIAVLILARILQGASAAVVWIVGLALLADTVSREDIGRAMGYVFSAMSLGVMMGPLAGGVVFDKGGYNAVFAMAYGLIAFDILLRLMVIEKQVAKKWLVAEGEGEAAQGLGVELREVDKRDRPARSHDAEEIGHASEFRTRAGSIVEEPLRQESHTASTKARKVPPVITLLKSKRLLAALWGSIVLALVMTSFDAVLPLYVKATFGWTSTGAGLIFLAVVLPSLLGPLVGWASDRYGARWFATAGFLLVTPIMVLLRFVTLNTIGHKVLLCALLALIGLSIDLVITPIMADITHVVERKERNNPGIFGAKGAYAQAYGLFNFAYALGCLFGPLWGGLVTKTAGWGTMTWSLGVLTAVSAIPTAIWCGGPIYMRKTE